MEELYRSQAQPRSPQESAVGWLSRLLFSWLFPMLRIARRRSLTVGDLFACPRWEESQATTDRLQEEWEKELSAHGDNGRKPSLFRALWRIHGWGCLAVTLLVFVEECFKNVLQPVALGWLLSYLGDPSGSSMGYTAFIGCALLVSLLAGAHMCTHHPYFFNMQRLGMRMRITCCSLLYRKSLRLSQTSLVADATTSWSGQSFTMTPLSLMSGDARRLDTSLLFPPYLIVAPLQTLLVTAILYQDIGWPSICCLGYMLLWVPLQLAIGHRLAKIRFQVAETTSRRIRLTNELVAAIRAIKMYAWERPFSALVSEVRRLEIGQLRVASALKGINMALFFVSSKFLLALCCVLYTVVAGGQLTADRAFVTMALLNSVRLAMGLYFPYGVGQCLELFASLERIQRFLLLDDKSKTVEPQSPRGSSRSADDVMLRLADVRASWTSDASLLTLNNVNFRVRRGEMVITAGPVGCGKTSLLMAVLGELPLLTGTVRVSGTVAYASQVPWLFNATLKRNVCFNSPVDEEYFRKVVEVCALDKDLDVLPHAEETLLEDNGASLSVGQKARVNLARAVYHDADLYLLDDPLSAVDAAVSEHIFTNCIQRHLLDRGKAVVLATHQLQYLRYADRVLLLDNNGKPIAYGDYFDIIQSGIDVEGVLNLGESNKLEADDLYNLQDREITAKIGAGILGTATSPESVPDVLQSTIRPSESETRLRSSSNASTRVKHASSTTVKDDVRILPAMQFQSLEEDSENESVPAWVHRRYAKLGAGWILLTVFVLSSVASQALFNGSDFWLSHWCYLVEQNQTSYDIDSAHLLQSGWLAYTYVGLILLLVVTSVVRALAFFAVCMRASVRLHDGMLDCLVRAPIAFFERNPIGRLRSRFTKDLEVIDECLPPTGLDISFMVLNIAGVLISVAIVSPYMIVPTVVLLVLFFFLWMIYIRAARDVKRLERVTRSPVLAHASATLLGLVTIRAYKAEPAFEQLFDLYQDRHTSTWNTFLCTTRWFGISLDFLAFAYVASVTMSLAVLGASDSGSTLTGGEVGLAIANALLLTGTFQWGMRQIAEMGSQMTSVERVLEYHELTPEAPLESQPEHRPPKDWPSKGAVVFRDVSLQYLPEQQPVLSHLSCEFKPGEKVGIVGRTGAGKSSIIVALFRLYEPEGEIVIDGVPTLSLGLHDLRSAVGIIPQEPSLFAGSLRRNLDPFCEKSDDDLWQALDEACLKDAVDDMPGGLSATVTDEGANLSSGQRQLVCLARAIVRRCRVLILDEATAHVDPRTDELVQKAIRHSFCHATVVTVAHRLHTVMDSDRVMVMDAGRIIEFDEPHILLQDASSRLSKLVDRTGLITASQLRNIARQVYVARHQGEQHQQSDENGTTASHSEGQAE